MWQITLRWGRYTSALKCMFNPLSPNSDKHLNSPYNVTTWSNMQVMRIKEMIIKDEMSWFLYKFSQLLPYGIYGEQWGENACWYWSLKGCVQEFCGKWKRGKNSPTNILLSKPGFCAFAANLDRIEGKQLSIKFNRIQVLFFSSTEILNMNLISVWE